MRLVNAEKILYENNRNYSYRILKESIISLGIEPGETISETQIQAALQTSRSPIREAIAMLSAEGLVEVYPQKKSVVTLINADELEQLSFMRETLEQELVKKCIREKRTAMLLPKLNKVLEKMSALPSIEDEEDAVFLMLYLDEMFHRSIYEAMECEAIYKAMRISNNQYNRFQALRRRVITMDKFANMHREIADMIRDEDLNKVEEHYQASIKTFADSVVSLRALYSQFFEKEKQNSSREQGNLLELQIMML